MPGAMYQAHFGLNKQLFDTGIAQDAAVFRSPKHEPLFAHLKLAFTSPAAVVTLTGAAGVGKTTLASAAVRASTTRLALAWINGTPTNATELLELLLTELGYNAHRTTRIERMQMWRQFLSEMGATDSRVFVVVERTEDLAHEVLRALDALTAADQSGSAGANVLLLGQSGLDRHLAAQPLDSLRQRIRLRLRVAPFDATDTEDYLRMHVARAGGELERLFAPGTLAALHRYSGGVARVINNLCETALTLAASEGKPQLTAELIAATAVDWLGLEDTEAAHEATTSAPAATTPTVAPAPVAAAPVVAPAPVTAPAIAAASALPVATPQESPPIVIATLTVAPVAAAPIVVEPLVLLPADPAAAAAAPIAPALRPVVAAAAASSAPQQIPVSIASDEPTLTEVDIDFDGAATDVPVVAATDFPVLTDAVEYEDVVAEVTAPPPSAAAPASVTAPSTPPRKELLINLPPAAAARAAHPAAPQQKSAPLPASAARIETAYAPKRPNAPLASSPPPAPKPPAPPPPAPAAKVTPPAPPVAAAKPSPDDDPLRQSQTLRAISVAKSIDDISSSMAETLFGDADLEMLSQALASAGWSEDEVAAAQPPPTQSAPAAKPKPKPAPPPSPEDDLLDLLGLGPDAPLELLDDSAPSEDEVARKAATHR